MLGSFASEGKVSLAVWLLLTSTAAIPPLCGIVIAKSSTRLFNGQPHYKMLSWLKLSKPRIGEIRDEAALEPVVTTQARDEVGKYRMQTQ